MKDKPSKADSFFGEVKDPKVTAIVGIVSVIASIFVLQYALYSVGLLLGIYGMYHGFRQKKWLLFFANLVVCVLAVLVKVFLQKG